MTNIQWTDKTWNPIVGCSKISEGCSRCYAINQAYRNNAMAAKMPNPGRLRYYEGLTEKRGDRVEWTGKVNFVPEALEVPLKTRKSTTWFVNSMSDLFHESVTDEQLDQIFAVMALTPRHVYQVLTKRPERMVEYCKSLGKHNTEDRVSAAIKEITPNGFAWYEMNGGWCLPNVWLGVTVENQKAADERIPLLLQTPAAIRFLSCEPLLEAVSVGSWLHLPPCPQHPVEIASGWGHLPCDCRPYIEQRAAKGEIGKIDWVIVGGESGHGAQPCDIEWIRSIFQQCKAADIPVFVKQLGSNVGEKSYYPKTRIIDDIDGMPIHVTNSKGSDINEFPKDLRIREFPVTK